jgi:hypothetical protein
MNQLPVRAASNLSLVRILEGEMKTSVEPILPLLSKAPRAHDQTPLQIAACDARLLPCLPGPCM